MTPEELAAKIAQLEEKNAVLEQTATRLSDLEARFTPFTVDPDEEYKPKTWKGNEEKQIKIAEETTLRILQEAEKKKEEIRKTQEESDLKENKKLDDSLKKLQEEGLIEDTLDKSDAGGRQRTQILGLTLRTGGTDVEAAARALKTLWDQGIEYDYESNSYIRAGSAPSQARMAPVASSAARTPTAAVKGPVNALGARGDLDEMQRRWEAANGPV